MKKITKLTTLVSSLILTLTTSAFAAEIPRESAPEIATPASIAVAESLVGGILDEVKSGSLGYGIASGKANAIIFQAVVSNQTNGYSYWELSPISQNAIWYYRDLCIRPDFYTNAESQIRNLIPDLILDVQNGKPYEQARDEAYTRIYQLSDSSYNPANYTSGDFAYFDTPTVDTSLFTVARKLLLNSVPTI